MKKYLYLLFVSIFSVCSYSQEDQFNLITWNIENFGASKDSIELAEIAHVINVADIVAIQEVATSEKGAKKISELADILNRSGSKWNYSTSDPTNSPDRVTESYAFLWKTSRVKSVRKGRLVKRLDSLIDREPYLMKFSVNGKEFKIFSLHTRPKKAKAAQEINALTSDLIRIIHEPIFIVGDFNLNQRKAAFKNLKWYGFNPVIKNAKTSIKETCKKSNYLSKSYDNIFYSNRILLVNSKVIDYVKSCDRVERANDISDHLPIMATFQLNE